MRVLILGSTGQLGSDCLELFEQYGNFQTLAVRSDITKFIELRSLIYTIEPQIIVNCAAYTNVDGCERHKTKAFDVNYTGPSNITDIAKEIGARVIHISTDYVFDGKLELPQSYTEDMSPNPKSVYGISKLFGENEILAHGENTVVRVAWLYSKIRTNFFFKLLWRFKSMPTGIIQVVDDQWGTPTWSVTVAHQIMQIIQNNITGVVHATSEGMTNWYDVAHYFTECVEIRCNLQPCKSDELNLAAPRPKNSILENSVLKSNKLSIFTDWKDDINTFVNSYRDQLRNELK